MPPVAVVPRQAAPRTPLPGPATRVRRSGPALSALFAVVDAACVAAAFVAASWLRTHDAFIRFWRDLGLGAGVRFEAWTPVHSAILLFQAVFFPLALAVAGAYAFDADTRIGRLARRTVAVAALGQLAMVGFLFLLKATDFPRAIVVLDTVLLAGALVLWRTAAVAAKRRRILKGLDLCNVLIVGTDDSVVAVAREIVRDANHRRRLVGFLAEGDAPLHVDVADPAVWTPPPTEAPSLRPVVVANTTHQPRHMFAVVGSTEAADVAGSLDGLCVEEVFVGPSVRGETLAALTLACRERGVDVHLVAPHHAALGIVPQPWQLGPFTVLGLHRSPIPRAPWVLKRAVDVAGAVVGLVLAAPVVAVAAVAIKLEDRSLKVFYGGPRVGFKGRHFRIWKLTTMRADADLRRGELRALNAREGPWFKIDLDRDPRLTRVGRFLRRYSLNEVPQFWNVLRGDMSLVGPRPLHPDEVSQFVDHDVRYYRCFDVRPGMTGLWQVEGRDDPSFERRIRLDFDYIERWSLGMDLKILVKTPLRLLEARRTQGV